MHAKNQEKYIHIIENGGHNSPGTENFTGTDVRGRI